MLSWVWPRKPCWGPNRARRSTAPASCSRSTAWRSRRSTEAGCTSRPTRWPRQAGKTRGGQPVQSCIHLCQNRLPVSCSNPVCSRLSRPTSVRRPPGGRRSGRAPPLRCPGPDHLRPGPAPRRWPSPASCPGHRRRTSRIRPASAVSMSSTTVKARRPGRSTAPRLRGTICPLVQALDQTSARSSDRFMIASPCGQLLHGLGHAVPGVLGLLPGHAPRRNPRPGPRRKNRMTAAARAADPPAAR